MQGFGFSVWAAATTATTATTATNANAANTTVTIIFGPYYNSLRYSEGRAAGTEGCGVLLRVL